MGAARRNLKRVIKAGTKYLALSVGRLTRVAEPVSRILTYHSVGHRRHDMNVTPDAFRQQMRWLAEAVPIISLDEAVAGKPGVAVTFDDGYRDNLVHAAPVLQELDIPATVFVVSGRAGGMLDHDEDPETARLMSWDEVRAIEAMGVTIGAHSLTHRRLAKLADDQQRVEIEGCAQAFQEALGYTPTAFAYPFGSASDYNATSVRLVQESGFKYAVSNRYGVNRAGADPWTLRRIWIDASDHLGFFRAKVLGHLDTLSVFESPLGLAARRALNRVARGKGRD